MGVLKKAKLVLSFILFVTAMSLAQLYLQPKKTSGTASFASYTPPLPALNPQMQVFHNSSLLYLPQNYQVFQRSTQDSGDFALNLKIELPSVNSIRVQVYDSNDLSKVYVAIETYVDLRQNDIYKALFELPAGGWYKIVVEQVNTLSNQAYRSEVEHFGMGDVFVTAGQSNSTSAGESLMFTKTGMVSAYVPQLNADGSLAGPGSWQLNNDPQPPEGLPTEEEAASRGYSRNNFGSVWPVMGDELYARQNIPIATAECGVGGTTISQWQKDYLQEGRLPQQMPYYRFAQTVRHLVNTTGVRMILWDQGESDNLMESQTYPLDVYGNKFKKLQADLAADTQKNIPWMIAKASFVPADPHFDGSPCDSMTANEYWSQRGPPPYVHSIRLALEKLIQDGFAFEGPDTDRYIGATGRYPGIRGACIHFSTSTLHKVGFDWADKISRIPVGDFPTAGSITAIGLRCTSNTNQCYCFIEDPKNPQKIFCPPVKIQWNTRNAKGLVHVKVTGNPADFVAGLPEGVAEAPWVSMMPLRFTLYDGDKILDYVTVTGLPKKPLPK